MKKKQQIYLHISKRFDKEKFVTLSQTLSWSHFLELVAIEDDTKRLFYEKVTTAKHWSVRALRDNIKVAQYVTQLPDKQWFIDKLNRSIAIAQANKSK